MTTAGDNEPTLRGVVTDNGVGRNLTTAVSLVVKIRKPDGVMILGAPTLDDQTTSPGSWYRLWGTGERDMPGVYWAALRVEEPAGRFLTYGPVAERVDPQLA
jgi:hypothetical protein